MMGPLDHPLEEVVKEAERVASQGGQVYQKFTCANCGARLTIGEVNKFYTEGSCDQCGHVTNLREAGCNMLVILGKGVTIDQAPSSG
jgi:predicted RNA-binding Zn-ribbon protein involved in translation (DUF1610 family)